MNQISDIWIYHRFLIRSKLAVKCGICGGEAPKQPCITEDGKCDLCGKEVILKEEAEEIKRNSNQNGLVG